MAERKKGKSIGNIIVWGLMALLVFSLGGFGIANFGASISTIGEVGDEPITVNTYYRELVAEIQAAERQSGERVSIAQAEAGGLISQVRSRLVAAAAMDNEAARLGLSVGDRAVAEQVQAAPAFQSLDGKFDSARYREALSRRGMSVEEYETGIRKETARTILQGAVIGGLPEPRVQTDTMMTYFGERRSFRWVRITPQALTEPLPEPSEEQLTTYYQGNTPDFTSPEMKRITYAWILPELLIDTVEIDTEAARKLYDGRAAEFQQPERRLVEQLVFSTDEAAAEARARLDAEEASFQDLVEARGLTLEQIDMGEVTAEELGDDASEAVFALDGPEVVGPFPTNLGPALFRMNGILAAKNVSFEEALPELSEELKQERARRVIADMEEQIEDLLASGATLEEIADETELELGQIDFWDGMGEGPATYNAFRASALAITADDFPELGRLEDGGIFAMRLDEVLEPRLAPLDEVRNKVIAGWETEETEKLLMEKANELAAQLEAGAPLSASAFPVEEAEGITRDGFINNTPPALVVEAFKLKEGEHAVFEAFGDAFVVQLTKIAPPAEDDERMTMLRQLLVQQTAGSLSVDIYNAFAATLADKAGVEMDLSAIAQVNAQISANLP